MNRLTRAAVLAFLGLLAAARADADQIAAADLQIQGVGLKVITVSATTGIDIPAVIQTEFGGKQNDEAQFVEGLLAVGELSGPGIDVPIRLETAPGHKFQIPGLSREGVYFLQNIRLMKDGDFLQAATPAVATITVSNLLQTSVRVRQLTPEEIRARGISVDLRNFDVYEYTFSFLVEGQTVEIPFPVIIDPRTHEVFPVVEESPYRLPPVNQVLPPRWHPPNIYTFEMGGGGADLPTAADGPAAGAGGGRTSIPAALIIPNNLAVLHQFFAVTLMVTNGAPSGSSVVLDGITAQIKPPAPLRTVKSMPSVGFNQPVPIVDATNGVTFLVAQAKGEAEWTMEGLQPGTHTVEVDVRATYKAPGQADFPLKGTVRASVIVHDPRFNVTFSHPDVVRKDIDYSTYSFITNMSPVTQHIVVGNGVPACAESPGANVCRVDGTPASHDLSIPAGEMRSIEYKLRPGITGHVFATAGTVDGDNITAAVQLHMGVSESGIPLSPATLVMPYYARFLSQPMISSSLQLLGLGYSLATAPLTPALAKHPRIIKTDVFHRATDIARAGQRVFLGEPMRDSLAHMSLDLLGNSNELREWDDLRRAEKSGRAGAASVARELEASLGTATLDDFVSRFATITAWRAPYLMAVTSSGKISVRAAGSNARLEVASEATDGWVRQLPYAELTRFRDGELAMVGRWAGDYEISVTLVANGPFTLDVILPAAADGSMLRGHFSGMGNAGQKLTLLVTRGAGTLELRDSLGGIAVVGTVIPKAPEPLHIIGARQDLNLEQGGHKVSILWNRPVALAAGDDLLAKLAAEVILDKDQMTYRGPRPMSAAALQDGGRVANVTFDHALSKNASYTMTVAPLLDPLSSAPVTFSPIDPVIIDNDRPGGIIFGHVLNGDNTPVAGAEVKLFLAGKGGPPQYDLSRASDGAFLFEYVPRDIENELPGTYKLEAVATDGKSTSVDGSVRLPGRVHLVNLVFLGRGSAEGFVRYDNGQIVPNAKVVIGSTMFNQFRSAVTDPSGRYSIADLPVGPLTFTATDEDGNITYAASEIRTAGQRLEKDLSIFRRPFPGTATIRGVVRRSDSNNAVPFAQLGVYSQGYAAMEGFADSSGRFEFKKVPIGFVTILAAEWSVSRENAAQDFDLAANEVRDVVLTLNVQPAVALAVIEGEVIREDPLHPGDPAFYQRVAGALVKIEKGQVVTADANGRYVITSVPVSVSFKTIQAYDPITTRTVTATLPQLDPTKINNIPLFIATADGYGKGTIRIRLVDSSGFAANGYRVIVPGFPPEGPTTLEAMGKGIYQLADVPVGATTTIWAIGSGAPPQGDQTATGNVKVEFNGHVAASTLRLPGQGTVRTKLSADIEVIGDVKLTYPAWDEAVQGLTAKDVTKSTSENGIAGYATFTGVPAIQSFTVSSAHPVYGYAALTGKVGFEGDVQTLTLQLNKLSKVTGVVYAIDGHTPIPGAAVRIEDGRQNPGVFFTLPDGSFTFHNVAANVSFRVIAEVTQEGTYRTGLAQGRTPATGGPVDGVAVMMRTQGSIDGRIVYAGYRVFDPQNSANNVLDNTPNDLSDNAPVPLANFILKELDFPLRSFGTTADPTSADAAGRFSFNNVFTGPLRITAFDPGNQEIRGSWTGTIDTEGEQKSAIVGIGAEGFGPVVVRVLDPNAQNAPVLNAEVTLIRSFQPFDLSTTDANGIVRFEQVPVGTTYKVNAYSKALGKSGSSANFTVTAITGAQLDVVLEFSGKVDGKLSDPQAAGRGIPGAPVTLTAQSFQTRASTDSEGVFVFDGVREGLFKLDAKDTLSNRRATASRLLTQANPNPFVALELEPIETLYVSVYLPNDAGGNSNILAAIVNIDVNQRSDDFKRSLQGNEFQMAGLFRNERYSISVKELGGASRQISTSANFPKGSSADPLKIVLPAYGAVEVRVTQGGSPAANARVTVSGGGKSVTLYTDNTGVGVASGIPLGPAFVQVTSVDNGFSGSTNVTLTSQSTPAIASVALGAFAGLTGLVEAEIGGPSSGTRVIASFGRMLEMLTDSDGRFTFQGIPTSSTVQLTYMGPDDTTVGARQTVSIPSGAASQIVQAPTVKLDATPPQVASIFPADGSNNVSPDSSMRVVFTERIKTSFLNTAYFQLLPADSATPVATTFTSVTNPDGTFTVTMTPPAAPQGQVFPLRSNTLYRVIVSGNIEDLTGNRLPAPRGASFITSDYAEPKVLKVLPSPTTALQPATTFEFRFNEPIDPAPWQTGGNGQFHFYKINAAGPSGAVIVEKPGRAFLDPASSLSLFFSPDDPIEQESFYRVTFSGVRDLQGNLLPLQTFHFFSYDLVKPFVTLVSPLPTDFPLISGVEYILGVDLRNGVAGGPVATDIAKVDYFRVDGATPTYIYTATAAPWTYRFVGPDAPPAGSTLTLQATATDLSFNESAPGTMTWQVRPNAAPQNVALTLIPATSIYPGNHALATVTFEDEGTVATVQTEALAAHTDGAEYKTSQVKQLTRARVSDPWPPAQFDFDLPGTLHQGTRATFNATVTDVRGLKTTATAGLDLTVDTIAPEIIGLVPAAQTRYNIGQKFQIAAMVRDLETGASEVTFSVDNQTIRVVRPSTRVTVTGNKTWTFNSGDITVPAKNVDTVIPITVTAKDYNNNVISRSTEVVYVGVNDPTVPKGAWLCPIDKAVYPAAQALPVKLQVRAADDISITGVKFAVPGIVDPISATRVGTTDVYEAIATVTMPAAGEQLLLMVTISDADPTHDITLPMALDAVAIDIIIDDRIQAVIPADAPTYANKSILVRGPNGRFIPHVALTLKNLLVLDGARVETLPTTTTTEYKLDLTITDRFYADCASSLDVSGRGYLGGWGVSADDPTAKNNDARGRIAGNTSVGGASTFASASHGGVGGEVQPGVTNAIYGDIDNPTDLGAGGGGGTSTGNAGSSGGGAIKLQGGVFAVAGAIRADGHPRTGDGNAGAGGSINITAAQFIAGPSAHISANGGDDDGTNNASRGAGGGRIAINAVDRFDVETLGLQIQSRGGRNITTSELRSFVDGGAGTIFLRRPGQVLGELFAGGHDDRFPQSVHLNRATPLSGELRFDRVTLGSRALVRADAALDIGGVIDDKAAATVDPTAVLILNGEVPTLQASTTPVDGSPLIQGATLTATYTATSAAGIGNVTLNFSPITPTRNDAYGLYPASATPAPAVALVVPADAVVAPATLTLSATDRAGRSVSLAPLNYTIVANAAPVIDLFETTPAALYPGKTVVLSATAHDDLKVTKLSFTRTIGAGTPTVTNFAPNTPAVTNQTLNVTIPIDTPGNQTMTVDLTVEDGYPGRVATKETKLVSILKDMIPPAVAIISPASNALFNEGTGNNISVRATITDTEVGVKEAFVQIENGALVPLTKSGNDYIVTLPVPPVDGTEIVTRTLTFTAKDYEGNVLSPLPSVTIRIQPNTDPNAPVVNWACSTQGAMYPAGYTARLRVFALGNNVGNPTNGVQKVEMFVGDSATPIAAAAVSGLANHYEVMYAIPAGTVAGSTIAVRAEVTNAAGSAESAGTSFTIVVGDRVNTANTTIAANDTTYDNKVVIVQGGTTTIIGNHTFDKLIVLDGAIVTHVATDATTIQRLTFTTTSNVFVSCTGSIDVSGRGFTGTTGGFGRTWPNTTTGGSYNGAGGSHGGRGGTHTTHGDSAPAYGNVVDPNEPGGAGGYYSQGTCATGCNAGGGIARIVAKGLVVDGKVLANGTQNGTGSGAGGSVRIDAETISGGGEIRADGAPQHWTAGGGGRIAIYYRTLTLDRTKITAAGGSANNAPSAGAAGTLYLQQVDAGGARMTDELVIDNLDRGASRGTPIQGTGTGTVSSVSGAVVTLSNAVPEWIEGSTIEFLAADGTQLSSYEIVSRTATAVTVRLATGEAAANASAGNGYRGAWRLDTVNARGQGVLDADSLRTPLIKTTATSLVRTTDLRGGDVILRGRMEANGLVAADSLTLESALLTHSPTTDTTINRLTVKVSGAMSVDATSTIDVTGRGFTGTTGGYGRTWPNTATGGSYNGAGGSHGGRGGTHVPHGDSAASYGSVFDPDEPGGAGGYYSQGTCTTNCNGGGGIARIAAQSLVLDGKVLANGTQNGTGSGAGGSVRIDAQTFSGSGEIRADGAAQHWTAGGGGRIAIYYGTLTVDRTRISAAGGNANNPPSTGATGTVYFREVDAGGAEVADELVIDNLERNAARSTTLATLGTGTVTAVAGAAVTLSNAVPDWIEGTTIEFLDATGTLLSSYEIVARTATTVTVRLASGETAPNASAGNRYRGVWSLSAVTARGQGRIDLDAVQGALITSTSTGVVRVGDLRGVDVILRGRLEANGLIAQNLTLQNGAVLTQWPTTDTTINRLTVKVDETLSVDATSSIDVSGRGFTGSTAGFGRTFPNTSTGGSYNGAGGSHGGRGGTHTTHGDSGPTHGSVFDPNEPGGAGGYYSQGTCTTGCNAGGGIARITAKTLALDGKVLSNGTQNSTGSGAGGSIRIDAETLSGAGEIRAEGAPQHWTSGGGGRIAVYYQTLALDRTRITAMGGASNTTATTGAAGTVFLKGSSQSLGDLIVDNGTRVTTRPSPLTSVGYSTVTAAGTDTLTDANAQFLAPDQLRGVRVVVNYDRTKSWPILTNTNKQLQLDVSAQALVAQVGQAIRGLYRFDSVKLRNARLEVIDLFETTTPVDKDAASVVIGNNQALPLVNASLITLQNTPTGAAVVGAAGAVTDLDTPIIALATNTATGNSYQANVNPDGSFAVGVTGNAGEPITFKARDANPYPLESPWISVGNLETGTPVPSQVNKTAWTADASFLPRTLSRDGGHLAVASYPTTNGASATLVILSVSDPAHPIFLRALNAGVGAIRDVTVSNGWAYIAGNQMATLNLTDPVATPAMNGNPGGEEDGVVVTGGYAFTAEAGNWNNDGRLHVYDVSSPASPRYVRSEAVLPGGNIHFTDLLALGSGHLIALTPDKIGAVGHDVVVIDRRDLNDLKKVADLDIPGFDAFRGALFGTRLYLISRSAAQFVSVDLSNPAAPVILGSVSIPAVGGGVAVVGSEALAAGGAPGLLTLDVASASPALTGIVPVTGNAFDVALVGAYAYVANELGIALVPAQMPPQISLQRITMTPNATMVTVGGAPQSVIGTIPITVELKNAGGGATISGLPVQSDGSFTAALPAQPGDSITIRATDGAGRSTGPLTIGTVPFGSQSQSIPITAAMADTSFLARNLASAGNDLVVGGYPADSLGDSDKIVLFDVAVRSNPVFKRKVATGAGVVRDVAVRNGWAFVAANRFLSLNLSNPAAVPVFTGDPGGEDGVIEIVGGYAFTAESGNWNNDGRIHIYDISDPSAPRFIRSAAVRPGGNIHFTGLAALGTDHLIAVTQDKIGSVGYDVVVVDRRDLTDLRRVGELDIPSFEPFRAKAVGTTLYVAGTGGVAVVDVSNPAAPVLVRIMQTSGYPRSFDVLGAILAVADGSAGATFADISAPSSPSILGNQTVGGSAWDVAFNGATLYVANEQGIAVIDGLGTPPLIDRALITTASDGVTSVTVTGSAKAILGAGPLTAEVRNMRTGVIVSGITVEGDGSFAATIAGSPGDALTLKATDSVGRMSGPVSIGSVPFGALTRHITIDVQMSDSGFLARNVAAAGNDVVVADYFNSDKILLFDGTVPGNPIFERKVATGAGAVRGIAVSNGWAFIAANRFMSLDLSAPLSVPVFTGDPGGEDGALVIGGGYAYTAESGNWNNDGRIHVYDISTPSSPRYLRSDGLVAGNIHFTGLALLGTDYLIAVTPDKTSGNTVGHDVVVIDRRDLNGLKKMSELDIVNFEPYRAHVVGNRVFVTGVGGGVAVVDVSNPAFPQLVMKISSAVAARGLEASGTTLAVATGTTGVTFIDASISTPFVIGSHPVPGAAWDVALSRGAMYVASEFGLTAISNVTLPPMVEESLLTVTPAASSTTVTGAAQSVTGIEPITVRITNAATSAVSPAVSANADGSFSATVAAAPGQALILTATDAAGRVTTINLASTYGATTSVLANQVVASDVDFRARRVVSDGVSTLVGYGANKALLFPQATPTAQPKLLAYTGGPIQDIEIASGYAFIAGNRFGTVNLSDPALVTNLTGDPGGEEGAVALSGQYAFTCEVGNWNNDGRIHIYNISNPALPVYVRGEGTTAGGFHYRGLVTMGSNYLIGISYERPSNVDRDITLIDRTNINDLVAKTELQLPGFDPLDAVIDGTTLYVAGGDAGVAIVEVDVTNTLDPKLILKAILNTGVARGIAIAGPNQIVVADGGGSLTFIDVTNKTTPVVTGTQILTGSVFDVRVVGNAIHVAAENYYHLIMRP